MKIILIIIGIIGGVFTIAMAYISGVIRGFKLMSQRNVKQNNWEKNILSTYYSKNKNVDPFVKNRFVREQLDLQKSDRDKKVNEMNEARKRQSVLNETIAKAIEEKTKTKAKAKSKKKKAKKNVKK
tara:strand:- start:2850 stop:3227 length:378 start_codon:yes stop_codon:yes gene_type:complete